MSKSMPIALCAAAALAAVAPAGAAEWSVTSELNLTVTQNAYSDNWEGEEVGSLSWAANSSTILESQLTPLLNTRAAMKLAFGQTHGQNLESRRWLKPVKSTDLVDFEEVLRFTLGGLVDPFASGHLESQFVDQSDAAKTEYLNPVRLTETFGVSRVIIEEEEREWTARIGGGLRQHIDRGVRNEDTGKVETEITSDGGIEFVSEFKAPLADGRITLSSRLAAFQALFYSESEALEGLPGEDDWRSVDLDWENALTAGITDHLMVSLFLEMLFDRQIDDGARFKETLALGLTFNLL